MARHGKNYQEAVKLLDRTKAYHPREAIELAKHFSSVEAGKFVNGILDKIRLDIAGNH